MSHKHFCRPDKPDPKVEAQAEPAVGDGNAMGIAAEMGASS
jgi:hypothetical protein